MRRVHDPNRPSGLGSRGARLCREAICELAGLCQRSRSRLRRVRLSRLCHPERDTRCEHGERVECPGHADNTTEPARERAPMSFTDIYLAQVVIADFRKNARGELGTRTATLHREGVLKLRENWIYKEKVS